MVARSIGVVAARSLGVVAARSLRVEVAGAVGDGATGIIRDVEAGARSPCVSCVEVTITVSSMEVNSRKWNHIRIAKFNSIKDLFQNQINMLPCAKKL